jgi:hypothetical protein
MPSPPAAPGDSLPGVGCATMGHPGCELSLAGRGAPRWGGRWRLRCRHRRRSGRDRGSRPSGRRGVQGHEQMPIRKPSSREQRLTVKIGVAGQSQARKLTGAPRAFWVAKITKKGIATIAPSSPDRTDARRVWLASWGRAGRPVGPGQDTSRGVSFRPADAAEHRPGRPSSAPRRGHRR